MRMAEPRRGLDKGAWLRPVRHLKKEEVEAQHGTVIMDSRLLECKLKVPRKSSWSM